MLKCPSDYMTLKETKVLLPETNFPYFIYDAKKVKTFAYFRDDVASHCNRMFNYIVGENTVGGKRQIPSPKIRGTYGWGSSVEGYGHGIYQGPAEGSCVGCSPCFPYRSNRSAEAEKYTPPFLKPYVRKIAQY